jgi:hypothetical protein
MPAVVRKQIASNLCTPKDNLNFALVSRQSHALVADRLAQYEILSKISQGTASLEDFSELLGKIGKVNDVKASSMLLGRLMGTIPQLLRQMTAQLLEQQRSQQPVDIAAISQQWELTQQTLFDQSLNAIKLLPDRHRARGLSPLISIFAEREVRSFSFTDPTAPFNLLLGQVMRLPNKLDCKSGLDALISAIWKLPETTRTEAYNHILDAISHVVQLPDEGGDKSKEVEIMESVYPDKRLYRNLISAINHLPEAVRAEAAARTLDAIARLKPDALDSGLRKDLAWFTRESTAR